MSKLEPPFHSSLEEQPSVRFYRVDKREYWFVADREDPSSEDLRGPYQTLRECVLAYVR